MTLLTSRCFKSSLRHRWK